MTQGAFKNQKQKLVAHFFKFSIEKSIAYVRANGKMSDVLNCRLGVRQGDTLLPTLAVIYINDFENILSRKFSRISVQLDTNKSTDLLDPEFCLKMFNLLHANDTALLTESEGDIQEAFDATTEYCYDKKMTIHVPKTKYTIFRVEKFKMLPICL